MPCVGAKKRETKSTPSPPGAVGDRSPAVCFAERDEIGIERGNLGGATVDDEMIAGAQHRLWLAAKRRDQAGRRLDRNRRARREVHFEQFGSTPRDAQRAGLHGAKVHAVALRFEKLENDVARGECGVAAEIDLDNGREPAQRVVAAFAHEECRLGQIVLGRDRLHGRVGQPRVERADPQPGCRRTACW
jgi:hypothetical protein